MGAAAREPSPRKSVESSHFVSWAASLIVNGRTRTVTEIEDAPSDGGIVVCMCLLGNCCVGGSRGGRMGNLLRKEEHTISSEILASKSHAHEGQMSMFTSKDQARHLQAPSRTPIMLLSIKGKARPGRCCQRQRKLGIVALPGHLKSQSKSFLGNMVAKVEACQICPRRCNGRLKPSILLTRSHRNVRVLGK